MKKPFSPAVGVRETLCEHPQRLGLDTPLGGAFQRNHDAVTDMALSGHATMKLLILVRPNGGINAKRANYCVPASMRSRCGVGCVAIRYDVQQLRRLKIPRFHPAIKPMNLPPLGG